MQKHSSLSKFDAVDLDMISTSRYLAKQFEMARCPFNTCFFAECENISDKQTSSEMASRGYLGRIRNGCILDVTRDC